MLDDANKALTSGRTLHASPSQGQKLRLNMTEQKPRDVLQPVDGNARALAKGLVRNARFAALGTIDVATGSPSVSRVATATFVNGDPGFFISALAAHQQNLSKDKRCSLLFGEPGKGDPLAHARMTLIGTARVLEAGATRDAFRSRYRQWNAKSKLYEDLPDFTYWRFSTLKISLNAGFGRAYALDPSDLLIPDTMCQDWDAIEPGVIEHMNSDHASAVDKYAGIAGGEGTDWRLACIDPEGMNLIRGDETRRLCFETPLQSVGEIRQRLVALARS